MEFGGKIGGWRDAQNPDPSTHFVGCVGRKLAIKSKGFREIREGMEEHPVYNLGRDIMTVELEGGNDPEVAAPTAECPEQVPVVVLAGVDQLTGSRDDVDRTEIVYCQDVRAR